MFIYEAGGKLSHLCMTVTLTVSELNHVFSFLFQNMFHKKMETSKSSLLEDSDCVNVFVEDVSFRAIF